MRKGAAQQLKSHLRERGEWVAKNELCRMAFVTSKGGLYGADLISRVLRTMEEDSIVAVKYVDGHSHYKYIPDYLQHLYTPTSYRDDGPMWKDKDEVSRLLSVYNPLYLP